MVPAADEATEPPATPHVLDVARTFLRLGLTSFGGPAAHIALFRDEFVVRRRWLADREFLDLLAVSNLIPGPTSTELAMHIGHRRAGWAGLLAGGLGFLLPAVAIVLAVAWGYVAFGSLPAVGAVLAGVAPVIVAIIAHATVGLARTAVTGPLMALTAAAAVVASLAGVAPILVLAAGGLAGLAALGAGQGSDRAGAGWVMSLPAASGLVAAATGGVGAAAPSLVGLGLVFVKIGAVLFGSGYLLVALLEDELVTGAALLTRRELLDAVAVGQFTPGPVITTATFIGYLLLGVPGAVVATVAIALPAFLFASLSVPVLARIRTSPTAAGILVGVSAAVVGSLVAVTAQLARTAVTDLLTAALAVIAIAVLLLTRVNPAWLIAAGAAVGAARGWVAA